MTTEQLPPPRPCSSCAHFLPDAIGDGAGIGACAVNAEASRPPFPCLWPEVARRCEAWAFRAPGI